jgi:hypothetical protein
MTIDIQLVGYILLVSLALNALLLGSRAYWKGVAGERNADGWESEALFWRKHFDYVAETDELRPREDI